MATEQTSPASLSELLFRHAGVGLCLVAPDGSVVRVNDEWLRHTGFTPDQVLGEDILDLFPAARDLSAALHARARAGQAVSVPRHQVEVLGRTTWWEGSISPVPMEHGTGILITAREVTAEVAREAELAASAAAASREGARLTAMFETLFERSADGVLLTVTDGAILRANPAACRALGRTEEEIRRERRDGVVVADERLAAALAERRRTGVALAELTFRRKDGSVFPVEVTSVVIPSHNRERQTAYTIFRDVTERRRLDAEVREALAANERLVAELRGALLSVKTLSGLLPICMWCKKIRNDAGYWDRIEAYLSAHTEATFSHGLCPECADRHYPDRKT